MAFKMKGMDHGKGTGSFAKKASSYKFEGSSKNMSDNSNDNSSMVENRKKQFNELKEKVGVIGRKIFGDGSKRRARRDAKKGVIRNDEKRNTERVSIAENLPEYKSTVKKDATTGRKSLRSYTEAYKAKKDDAEFMKKYPTQKSFEDAAEAWWKTQGAGSPKKYNKKK